MVDASWTIAVKPRVIILENLEEFKGESFENCQ